MLSNWGPRPHISVGAALQADIPIFVPCFNAATYARAMVEQLRAHGLRRIVLVDNGSTYPPMLEFLNAPGPGVTVVAQQHNKGPRDIFADGVNFALLPQFFCITDPDLVLNPDLPDDFVAQLASLTEQLGLGKAGFALDISDRSAMRQDNFWFGGRPWKIWDWESQFWREQVGVLPGGDPVFKAPVDTTFARYNKRFFNRTMPLAAVRVAGRFTCRHLPWYRDVGLSADERQFYEENSRYSFYLRDKITDPATEPRFQKPLR